MPGNPYRMSLWMATAEGPRYPSLDEPIEVDVAILGGGIAGLQTALLCQREGQRVAVVESRRVAAGVTGYTTAKVTALQGTVYSRIASRLGAETAAAYASASTRALEAIA